MKHEFHVDGISYVVSYEKNEFFLYVDGLKSKKKTSASVIDDGFCDFEDDGPVERVFYMSNLLKTKNPMKVYAEVMYFVKSVVGKKMPYYFTFSANEKKKKNLYGAVAERIAKKFGYSVFVEGNKFSFYQIKG